MYVQIKIVNLYFLRPGYFCLHDVCEPICMSLLSLIFHKMTLLKQWNLHFFWIIQIPIGYQQRQAHFSKFASRLKFKLQAEFSFGFGVTFFRCNVAKFCKLLYQHVFHQKSNYLNLLFALKTSANFLNLADEPSPWCCSLKI